MTRAPLRTPVFVLALVAAALSGLNWASDPADAWLWAGTLAAALLALAANALVLTGGSEAAQARDRVLRRSLILAFGLISLALGFAFADQFGLGEGADKRATLVGIGLILVLTGNMLPKTVLPLASRGRNPARQAAAERFAGRVFVLCGAAFVLCALVTPLAWVTVSTGICGLIAFFAAIIACFWVARGPANTLQED